MEKITNIVHYWLFKRINEKSMYYHVRIQAEGNNNFSWIQGYKNHLNLVSTVGPSYDNDDSLATKLEKEFQEQN